MLIMVISTFLFLLFLLFSNSSDNANDVHIAPVTPSSRAEDTLQVADTDVVSSDRVAIIVIGRRVSSSSAA